MSDTDLAMRLMFTFFIWLLYGLLVPVYLIQRRRAAR